MNSLTYLSHQFDVFASAKTPPSTPTSDHPSFIDDRRTSRSYKHVSDTPLQRVKTWSTRSFLFPPSSSSHTSLPPKRSFSSPADFFTLASLQRPLVSPASSTLSSSLDTRPAANLEAVIRRIFFIRILVLAWDTLCAAWTSVAGVGSVESRYKVALKIDAASGKEIHENEAAKENRELPPSVQSPFFPLTNRSHTDSTPPFETKPEPQSLSLHPLSSSTLGPTIIVQAADQSVGTSRSPTPILNARKTPFHLPKTLVLDLDETLIHSTSRPIFSSGNGGPGLLGLDTFGRRNKGAGHTVEVVLGGRSTLYHVYKRPFVDFFLRTVSFRVTNGRIPIFIHLGLGFGVVHPRHIHCFHAGICGPSH
jgi:CTD nuclear envelope phosphatase 1